ncbi:Ger(x)C family spore germination protein [Metabacillus bambusae]|uniref:Ger(X)C family spore germination protein n=1 Tax=Metabacillus bambusae TaxID=2795218 RepID=A0ABS3N2H2_9BACI|nr:Ger(x)C family spore germination protein [Metabacillus bambusae]MBO1512448.1 Ger(x)C family spore germination protein [Metabacillus bambusae]
MVIKTNYIISRKLRTCLILLFLLPLLSGCWSSREIDNLAIINVLGIDQNEVGEYVISTVIANQSDPTSTSSANDSKSSGSNSSIIKTATGKSIHEAMGVISSSTSKRIYLGHVNNIIFGENVALKSMEESLDYFRRENDFRPNINVLVTKGLAADIVKIKPELQTNLGFTIRDIINENRYVPTAMGRDISQFMKALSSNTVDPFTTEIGIVNNTEQPVEQVSPNSSTDKEKKSNQNEKSDIGIKGTAVFKGGNLAGWLDERETRGLLWVQGEVDTGIVVLSCDGEDNGVVSLGIGKSNSKLIPKISKDKVSMTVSLDVNAEIRSVSCLNLKMDTSQIERLNKRLENLVKQEVMSAISKAKDQWQTDIFGFGEVIYRNNPKKWDQMSKQWRTSGLKNMGVQVKVTGNISGYGLQEDPIKANESR